MRLLGGSAATFGPPIRLWIDADIEHIFCQVGCLFDWTDNFISHGSGRGDE